MTKLSDETKQKIMDSKKKASERRLCFELDSHSRLTSNRHCVMIETRSKIEADWTAQYFYVSLIDAFRGYIKHRARKKLRKNLTGDLSGVLDHLQDLEKLVERTGVSLQKQFAEYVARIDDPVLASFVEDVDD